MNRFLFKKIDAFATSSSAGNPAGYVLLGSREEITDEEMQRIARELKGFVSEVGYLWPNSDGSYGLRYFSSEREVEFCGHATIAIMYDLIMNDSTLMKKNSICIVTNKGRLEVFNMIGEGNSVFITAPAPVFSDTVIDREDFSKAMGISQEEISDGYPCAVANAGLETLIIPIRTLDSVIKLSPNIDELKAYCLRSSVDIVLVFSDRPYRKENRFRTRVFAPTFGYLEDPATGSGNAALGYYLLRYDRWDGSPMRLEQSGNLGNPNIVHLATRKDEEGIVRVMFGGAAIVRIQGEYILP